MSRISFSSSQHTTGTYTTATTEWGPGTLLGRGIMAFGEAAKDIMDRRIIQWKLATFKSIFPHNNVEDGSESLDKVYDELLELSRSGFYEKEIRQQALAITLVQIASQQTRQLIKSLLKWPLIEIQLFLSQLISCLPQECLPEETGKQGMHRTLRLHYISSVTEHRHSASPFITFMGNLAQASEVGREAVLGTGFLQTLLFMLSIPPWYHPNGVVASQELLRVSFFPLLYLARDIDLNSLSAQPIIRYPLNGNSDCWITELPLLEITELSLILMQMGGGIADIIDSLESCSKSEQRRTIFLIMISLIMISLIMTLLPSEYSLNGVIQRNYSRKHVRQSHTGLDSALWFMSLAKELSLRVPISCLIILESRFLDVLLAIAARGFSRHDWGVMKCPGLRIEDVEILQICYQVLVSLSAREECCRLIYDHPISWIWPKHHLFHKELGVDAKYRWSRRRLAWRQLDTSIIQHRLRTIPWFYYQCPLDDWEKADFCDACMDLLEYFSHPEIYGSDISLLALSTFHPYMKKFSMDRRRWQLFSHVLSQSAYEDNFKAFSTVITHDKSLSTTMDLLWIMSFAAAESEDVRRALLDADILVLLLHFIREMNGNSSPVLSERALLLMSLARAPLSPIRGGLDSIAVVYSKNRSTTIVHYFLHEDDAQYEEFWRSLDNSVDLTEEISF